MHTVQHCMACQLSSPYPFIPHQNTGRDSLWSSLLARANRDPTPRREAAPYCGTQHNATISTTLTQHNQQNSLLPFGDVPHSRDTSTARDKCGMLWVSRSPDHPQTLPTITHQEESAHTRHAREAHKESQDNTGDHQTKARIQRPSTEATNQKEETKAVTAHQPLDDKQWTPPSLVSTGRDREKRYENTDDTVKKQH